MLHEDLSDCNLFLRFCYNYNMANEDWFGTQVDEVRVFLFDKQGKYVKTIIDDAPALRTPDYQMPIPLDMKGYTMVIWAGRLADDYLLADMVPGDPIEKLTVSYQPTNYISAHKIAPQWHSGPELMTFNEANGTQQTVCLIRNTNDIHVTMSDGGSTTTERFDLKVKGANGTYNYQNNFTEPRAEITYRPTETEPQQTSLSASIYTMRLVKGTPLMFSAKDNFSGKDILIEGKTSVDLTEYLLKDKPASMSDQEYLDRRYIWDITLSYNGRTFLAVSITINGWTHWFHNTEL